MSEPFESAYTVGLNLDHSENCPIARNVEGGQCTCGIIGTLAGFSAPDATPTNHGS